MEFIETPTFTRWVLDLMPDDEYAELQKALIENPERGDLIRGSGGLRKVRHTLPGSGKSGGVRVIYYWLKEDHQIYMLLVYPKSKKDNLTAGEVAQLKKLVEALKDG